MLRKSRFNGIGACSFVFTVVIQFLNILCKTGVSAWLQVSLNVNSVLVDFFSV
jgi:hypothetical protein